MDLTELDQPYNLTSDQIKYYRLQQFIKLKEVLSERVVNYFNEVITRRVNKLNPVEKPLEQRDTYGKAFLQLMNLWVKDDEIKKLVKSRRLAQIATDLMGTSGVKLYHDQALFKEAGGGITPWHADQYYWPLSNDQTVTIWIPLQRTPLEMGPLEFSAGSHHIVEGRELAISDQSEQVLSKRLRVTDFPHVIEPFDLGEVSFHSGWIFHRAGANITNETRKVMTIIYMDKEMRLKRPENDNQKADWETWCPGAQIGEIIDTPLNPVLFP